MTTRSIRHWFAACAGALTLAITCGAAEAQSAPKSKARAKGKVMPMTMPAEATPPETTPIDFVFGGRYQTDYNFRGISQSNRKGSGQGYGELQLFDNFLYAGVAAYGVDLPTRPEAEIDLTAGIRPKFGPFTFDLGVIYYHYPNEKPLIVNGSYFSVRDTDFLEFAGRVSYTYQDTLTLGANVFHASDWLGTKADATYVSGTAKYVLPEKMFGFLPSGFAISAEYGHYFLGRVNSAFVGNYELPDYNYGNVGISYTYENFTFDVRYHDTDLKKTECFTITGDPRGIATGSGRSKWCSDAVIATLSVDFAASKLPGVFAPPPR